MLWGLILGLCVSLSGQSYRAEGDAQPPMSAPAGERGLTATRQPHYMSAPAGEWGLTVSRQPPPEVTPQSMSVATLCPLTG